MTNRVPCRSLLCLLCTLNFSTALNGIGRSVFKLTGGSNQTYQASTRQLQGKQLAFSGMASNNGNQYQSSKRHLTTQKMKSNQSGDGSNVSIRKETVSVQPPRPNSCTYWVTDSFLAGEHPTHGSSDEEKTRQKIRKYLHCGISYFVDLTQEGEKPSYERLVQEEASKLADGNSNTIVVKRFAIPDFDIPDSPVRMQEILDAIDTAIDEQQHKVYVHCRGGIGRTGTTVGCYLARHGYSGKEALQEVNRLFQSSDRSMESYYSPETEDQMNFVRGWNER